jgi:uncharacterized protein (DUF927 family)
MRRNLRGQALSVYRFIAADAAYKLANGQGKQRMSADTQMRETAEWRVLFLSDGETKRGVRRMAGQAVRVTDIAADAGHGVGVFDHPAGFASGRELSEHLGAASLRKPQKSEAEASRKTVSSWCSRV